MYFSSSYFSFLGLVSLLAVSSSALGSSLGLEYRSPLLFYSSALYCSTTWRRVSRRLTFLVFSFSFSFSFSTEIRLIAFLSLGLGFFLMIIDNLNFLFLLGKMHVKTFDLSDLLGWVGEFSSSFDSEFFSFLEFLLVI